MIQFLIGLVALAVILGLLVGVVYVAAILADRWWDTGPLSYVAGSHYRTDPEEWVLFAMGLFACTVVAAIVIFMLGAAAYGLGGLLFTQA